MSKVYIISEKQGIFHLDVFDNEKTAEQASKVWTDKGIKNDIICSYDLRCILEKFRIMLE